VAWLPIGKASKLLGVNESTLRHWADRSTIRIFRTSGGHRRFAQEDLQALMNRASEVGNSEGLHNLRDLALSRIRRRLGRRRGASESWHSHIPEALRPRLRLLGRRLLAAAGDFLTSQRGRPQALEEARDIGQEYGWQAAQSGLPLDEALEAFLFFRDSLDSVASELTRSAGLTAQQAVELCRQLNTFTDQVLLSSVRAYRAAGDGQN